MDIHREQLKVAHNTADGLHCLDNSIFCYFAAQFTCLSNGYDSIPYKLIKCIKYDNTEKGNNITVTEYCTAESAVVDPCASVI